MAALYKAATVTANFIARTVVAGAVLWYINDIVLAESGGEGGEDIYVPDDKPCPKASESTPGTPDPDEEEKIRHSVFEPDDLFEIVEEGEVVGTIKYKHIPRGALIHEFPAPKGPIRGQVLVGEIQGGAIGDLFNLQVF